MQLQNKKILLLAGLLSVILSLSGVLVYHVFFQKKIVSVDILRLIDGYRLKQDLENAQKKELDTYIRITDSLKNNFDQAYKHNPNHPQLQALYADAAEAEKELSQIFGQYNEENNKKIWTRLNPVIDRFSEERGYDIVIGANGMGTVLYMKNTSDITDQLVQYINDEYENKQ